MDPLVRWLLTYLLHSTLLLGLAALARLALGERRLALQEALLRAALVGGFVTAGLQVGLGLQPLGGSLAMPAALAVGPTFAVAPPPARPPDPGGLAIDAPSARLESSAPASVVPAWVGGALASARVGLRRSLALGWALLAGVALARLGVAAVRLRHLLEGRRPIDAGALGPLAARLGRSLGLRRPVRLSAAQRLSAPLATGVLRPEICLPERAVAELGTDQQAALCAHELAHVARRDPAWLLLARLAEALAPVQPLNAWARRRLQDVAECLSDDLAVTASGRPLGLARSLVDVASWTIGELSLPPVAAVGAVSARSRLGHRVERLMNPARTLERPRRLLLPVAATIVLATALVTPVVSGGVTPDEPPPPAPPAAPKARPAPAPAPHPASKAEVPSAEARERLEQLSRQIAERARLNEAEMRKVEAEIEAVTSKIRIDPAAMERVSAELEKAARELAESASADVAREGAKRSARTEEAARRMAELERQLRETTRAARLPADEVRALAEKARALAEQARPTADELREIRRLSADQARLAAELTREQARLTTEQVREAMRAAREALREAGQQMQRALDAHRDAQRGHREEQRDDEGDRHRD